MVKMGYVPVLALALVLGLLSSGLEAEEGRRILVAFSTSTLDPLAWAASLEGSLSRTAPISGVLRARAGEDERRQAGLAACDLALVVAAETTNSGESVRVVWHILSADPGLASASKDGGLLKEGEFEASLPSQRRLAETFWRDLSELVAELAATQVRQGRAILAIEALPKTRIHGLGKDLVMPASGQLELELDAPATYVWTASAKNMLPATGNLVLSSAGADLRIRLERIRLVALGLDLHQAAFPGLSLGLATLGDSLSLLYLLDQFYWGLNFTSDSGSGSSLIWSVPLIQPGLGFSWSFGKIGQAVRPFVSMAGYARLSGAAGNLDMDSIAPYLVSLRLGIEWRPTAPWGFYAQAGVDWYPGCDGLLMAASNQGSSLPYAYEDGWYLEYPAFSIGLRLRP